MKENKYMTLEGHKEVQKMWANHIPKITEKVNLNEIDKTTEKLLLSIFKGTDVIDVLTYPKKPKNRNGF